VRLVFCGTAQFAVPSLMACATGHDVVAVVTRADRPGHRGRPAPRPVGDAAQALGLPVLTPLKIGAPEVVAELLALAPDCLVVAAYGQILPPALIDAPPYGAINVHASLLPRWRGASPIARAIMAGDVETGVSIMRMEPGLDTGPVYLSVRVPIPSDATTPKLTDEIAALGASALLTVLAKVESGEAHAEPQAEDGVTYAPRLTRDNGGLDWTQRTAIEVDRLVRALQPWPGVRARMGGIEVEILAGEVADLHEAAAPGAVARREGESVVVATREGGYRVDRITPPGRPAMTPAAFLRGRRDAEAATS
jgi:methionyl-tRNA formyltransferase